MMRVKIHVSEGRPIYAVCDDNLLGKKFDDGEAQLDLSGGFYKGDHMEEDRLLRELKNAYILNLVGEETIAFAIKHDLIKSETVKKIANIPYTQVTTMV